MFNFQNYIKKKIKLKKKKVRKEAKLTTRRQMLLS